MENPLACSHYNTALALISTSDLSGAMAELEVHLLNFPDSHHGWHALAQVAILAGEYHSAVDFLSQAMALSPAIPAYFADMGEVYRRLGDLPLAKSFLERALDLDASNVEGLINLGCVLGEQQLFDDAKVHLLKALDIAPDRVDVYVNLGVLEQRDGRDLYALNYLLTAIALAPDYVPALAALGETSRRLARFEEAKRCFTKVLEVDPANSLVRAGLADILALEGKIESAEQLLMEVPVEAEQIPLLLARARLKEELLDDAAAIALYEEAIALDPKSVAAYRCLVAIHRENQAFDKALELLLAALVFDGENCLLLLDLAGLCHRDLNYEAAATYFYNQVLRLRPNHIPTLIATGMSYGDCERFKEAESCFEHALSLDSDNPEIWATYAVVLMQAGKYEISLDYSRRALERNWLPSAVLVNMGNTYWRMGKLDLASEQYEKSLVADPNQTSSIANLASIYFEQGQVKKSNAFFRRAEKTQFVGKAMEQFRLNRSFARLAQGDLTRGWEDYEFRPMNSAVHYSFPKWEGQSLAGKTLLLWQDQGLGDVLMFATMFQEVIAQAAKVVIECSPKLTPLLRRTFPQATVLPLPGAKGPHPMALNGIDYQISHGSLCALLRPTVASFPRSKKGYLKVDASRKAYWQSYFDALNDKLKVGICWRSKVRTGARANYYAEIEAWEKILRVPDVHFINLQYDDCSEELALAKSNFDVEIETLGMVDMFNDIDETAAVISALDLVISAPTAVAMISGGIGRETWWLCNLNWLGMGTKQHKFFHNLRAFEKPWDEPWEESFTRVAASLSERAAKK